MKIVIANGTHEADFIIKKFKIEKHELIVINNDKDFGTYISNINRIPVIFGDPTKAYVLEDANAYEADVFIALSTNDIDNYVSCITAKSLFHAKRVVCVVRNPKRVQLFKQLGIDSVISSTYVLGENIKNESIIEDFMHTISIENDKIMITELIVDDTYQIAHQKVREAHIPPFINISCIYREPDVLIVNGDTIILPNDRLVIVTTPEYHDPSIQFIQTKVTKNGSNH
jgi:trk system potassium uptake protein TrkA